MAHNLFQGREAGHREVALRRMVTPGTLEIRAAKKLNGERGTSLRKRPCPSWSLHKKLMPNREDGAVLVRGSLPLSAPESCKTCGDATGTVLLRMVIL